MIPVPLYHCFGMVMGNLGCVSHGATMIYPEQAFDAESVLRAVAEERATALFGVPTMFIAELALSNFADFDLDVAADRDHGGRPVSGRSDAQSAVGDAHARSRASGYGMTETSPVSTQTRIGTPLDKQVSTVGRGASARRNKSC